MPVSRRRAQRNTLVGTSWQSGNAAATEPRGSYGQEKWARRSSGPFALVEVTDREWVVTLGARARGTIVAALDEMQRYVGESPACTTRHWRIGSVSIDPKDSTASQIHPIFDLLVQVRSHRGLSPIAPS
jgi:hypothetical protein